MIRKVHILVLVVLPCAFLPARAEDADEKTHKEVDRDGVTLVVELKRAAAAGGPYYVSIGATNNRSGDVAYGQWGRFRVFDVRLFDSEDKAVPFTRFGQRVLARNGPSVRGKKLILGPGRRLGSYLNLARLFDLSETGTYRLAVSKSVFRRIKDMGEPITLEIEDIPVTVRNPTEEDREKWR